MPVAQTAPSALEQYGPLPCSVTSQTISPVSASRAIVPSGTSITTSAPFLPVLRAPLPLSPSPAKMWRWYLRCISVQYWLLPRRTMLPPLPPSPPSGPPNSTNFSRRKWREPRRPCPSGRIFSRSLRSWTMPCSMRLVRFVRGPAQIPFLPCGGGCVSSARRAKIRFFFGLCFRNTGSVRSGSSGAAEAFRFCRAHGQVPLPGSQGFVRAA